MNSYDFFFFFFQVKENHALSNKALLIESLQTQLDATKEQDSIIAQLRARVAELEREKNEVQVLLADSQAETKIALESMEKERKDKDEVFFRFDPACIFLSLM